MLDLMSSGSSAPGTRRASCCTVPEAEVRHALSGTGRRGDADLYSVESGRCRLGPSLVWCVTLNSRSRDLLALSRRSLSLVSLVIYCFFADLFLRIYWLVFPLTRGIYPNPGHTATTPATWRMHAHCIALHRVRAAKCEAGLVSDNSAFSPSRTGSGSGPPYLARLASRV